MSDLTLQYVLRMLQPDGPNEKEVWLITNVMGQQLTAGGDLSRNKPINAQLDGARLWQHGGVKLVIMSVIAQAHYFAIVAHLCNPPKMYIIESIGNYSEPAQAALLRDVLLEKRREAGLSGEAFQIVTPIVPRQRKGSNLCGIFMIKFITDIINNPQGFILMAECNSLGTWFTFNESPDTMREN